MREEDESHDETQKMTYFLSLFFFFFSFNRCCSLLFPSILFRTSSLFVLCMYIRSDARILVGRSRNRTRNETRKPRSIDRSVSAFLFISLPISFASLSLDISGTTRQNIISKCYIKSWSNLEICGFIGDLRIHLVLKSLLLSHLIREILNSGENKILPFSLGKLFDKSHAFLVKFWQKFHSRKRKRREDFERRSRSIDLFDADELEWNEEKVSRKNKSRSLCLPFFFKSDQQLKLNRSSNTKGKETGNRRDGELVPICTKHIRTLRCTI